MLCPNQVLHGAFPQAMDRAIAGTFARRDQALAAWPSPSAPGGGGLSQHTIAKNADRAFDEYV